MKLITTDRIITGGCIVVFAALTLALCGCQSKGPTILPNGELYEARTLLDRVEFDADEIGCIDIRGEVDLNPAPFFSSKAQIILKKSKGENAPEC